MNRAITFLSLAAVLNCAVADALFAQNYTLTPGDSIVATAQFDDLTVFNILQNNISTDSLFLEWEKVSAELPLNWEATICDNSNCFTDLKESGDMLPVVPGEYGFLSLHITPHLNSGFAIIRYRVWDIKNPAIIDTLTWIVSAGITGIENQSLPVSLFLCGDQLTIQEAIGSNSEMYILNMEGKVMLRIKGQSLHNTTVDVSDFPSGIYLLDLKRKNIHQGLKFFLQ